MNNFREVFDLDQGKCGWSGGSFKPIRPITKPAVIRKEIDGLQFEHIKVQENQLTIGYGGVSIFIKHGKVVPVTWYTNPYKPTPQEGS